MLRGDTYDNGELYVVREYFLFWIIFYLKNIYEMDFLNFFLNFVMINKERRGREYHLHRSFTIPDPIRLI